MSPPDADRPGTDGRVARFAPVPRAVLPFPTLVVASNDDVWCDAPMAKELASGWGADFVLLDQAGHINAESGLGAWREGQALLDQLLVAGWPAPPAELHRPLPQPATFPGQCLR